MKNKIYYVGLPFLLFCLNGCVDSMMTYTEKDDKVFFTPNSENVVVPQAYTFVFEPTTVLESEIYLPVNVLGFVVDYDREINFKQVDTTVNNAQAGKHFVPFDDPSRKGKSIIPAGKNVGYIAIRAKRDAGLANESANLRIQILENDNFKVVYADKQKKLLVLSDQLSEPQGWNSTTFGAYGPVKHRFMIDTAGVPIDDNYFLVKLGYGLPYKDQDIGYQKYIAASFQKALNKLNEERKLQGLGDLKEAPTPANPNGVTVKFV